MGRTFSDFSEVRESDQSLKHHSKDPVSYMCLAGAVVACWFLTQEATSLIPFTAMTNIFVTEF